MISNEIEPFMSGWAWEEFKEANLGDQRLTSRLIKLADRFSELPESPINQACLNWAETKGAYRFFKNENVSAEAVLTPHAKQTIERAKQYKTILAIQDTSYFSYTGNKQKKNLGIISKTPGKNVDMLSSNGIVMHTAFAVTTEGLPLGIIDQNLFSRESQPEGVRELKKRTHNNGVPIEEKESFRWLESLNKTKRVAKDSGIRVVTVCDRECDIYEFFELACKIESPILVRSGKDRIINKSSRCSQKEGKSLWSYIQTLPSQGEIKVEIPAREQKKGRIATLKLRFGSFTLNPPRNHIRHKTENLPDLNLNAVYVVEVNCPENEEPLEWMLLTNLRVHDFDEAVEKIFWYCLRWRIEVFHKILKSGLRVESCRLQTADRLIRYLTVMSIIAWRIFWITLIGRSHPDSPCTLLLAENEWKILHLKIYPQKSLPIGIPTIREVVRWIAQLGGFLGRKRDGEPGPIALWRGWMRFCDLIEGWNLATGRAIYG